MPMTRRDVVQCGLASVPMFLTGGLAPLHAHADVRSLGNVIPPIRWSAEKKLSFADPTVGSDLLTAHAPSLASEDSSIYLAHAGDGGSTLWFVPPFPAPGPGDKPGSGLPFASAQVKPFGKAAKIHGAPACVRYNGYTAILAADDDRHGVTCYFFDGSNWASTPVFAESGGTFEPPKAAVVGNQLEVFAAKDGAPRHAFCNGRIFDRSSWKMTAPINGTLVDSLAASVARAVAVCKPVAGDTNHYQGVYVPGNGSSLRPPFQKLVLSGNSPAMNDDGAAVFVHGDNVGYLYRAANSHALFYAYAETGVTPTGSAVTLQPSVPIPGKSSELPGVTIVGNAIYLAYKGDSTHDMYWLRGDL